MRRTSGTRGPGSATLQLGSLARGVAHRARNLVILSAALGTLLAVCVAAAAADPGAEESSTTPSEQLLIPGASAFEDLEEGQEIDMSPKTDPMAAEELPHADLNREEAEELLTSVFPFTLVEPAGIFDHLQVEEFQSDHVAVVGNASDNSAQADQSALLDSILPLQVKDDQGEPHKVDLGLEVSPNGLNPINPLVPVEIPRSLEEGITLPDEGVKFRVVGAPGDRAPSNVEQSLAFYPNIAADTDMTIAPTPIGVETFTQLRTSAAPTLQTFSFDLPGETVLRQRGAGAEIARAGEVVAVIPPPTAIDATGEAVPVTMELSGNALTVEVAPGPTTIYPVLVDPYIETFTWTDFVGQYDAWYAASNSPNFFGSTMGIWGGQYGLNLKSTAGYVTPNAQADWNYYVPRYFTDYETLGLHPTSYIDKMTFSGMYFWFEDSAPHANMPMAMMGIWDEQKGAFATVSTRNGSEGEISNGSVSLANINHVTDVKNGGIALSTGGDTVARPRHLWVPQATVEITDSDIPSFSSALGPANWLGASTGDPVEFSANDSGLGISGIKVKIPSSVGGFVEPEQSVGCIGNAEHSCPRTWSSNFVNFNPAVMPQGEDVLQLFAKDPILHWSPGKLAKVKVDHTNPSLSIAGNLTEQATAGTNLPEYTLNYSSADGDSTEAAATTPVGTTGTGPGQMQKPMGVAVDAAGNVFVVDRENNRVEKFDSAGNFLSQFGTTGSGDGQFSDPRGITITASGNIWVAETGNKRLQEFNSKGEFIRKFGYAGGVLGVNKFVEPYGVSAGPSETLWVTDIGSHNVYRFKEDGTYLGLVSNLPLGTTMKTPTGVDVDAFGNAWVAEQSTNKVYEFDSSGKYFFSFGATGTADGQMQAPNGVAIASSGNILVADVNNNRIQEFKPDGSFLRKFGSLGTGNAQLTEARGVATGPGNTLYVADLGNHRVTRWTHADQDPQSGVAKVEVKVDGTTAMTNAPGCATKNCTLNGSWTLDADDYSVGAHKVDVIATDGVGLATTRTLNIETHGDRTAPSVALSGTMTEQASLGTTRPAYTLRMEATDPGSAAERKSGVAATTIKVDGKVVDSTSAGCPAEGCSVTREWTLNSNSYSAGSHNVEAIATDGAGRTTTKTLTITIARDTTAPQFEIWNYFYTAPEGWLEQKTYNYNATATDVNGYGVTSMTLKIDGNVVKTVSQTCSEGGCSKSLGIFTNINMANYGGGAHPAELIASDGAGNTRKRTWTINVDPDGTVSAGEATDTIEAVETTAPETTELTPVSAIVAKGAGEGQTPTLTQTEEGLATVGAPAESAISVNPNEGFAIQTQGFSESGEEVEHFGEVQVTPTYVLPGAPAATVSEEAAAVYPDTTTGVDTVVRPAYDGIMAFQVIREASAPEDYSWEVTLREDESLKLIDEQHAGVFWEDGTEAMLITAQAAHGADGEAVPVTLAVAGNVVTETVHFHQPGIIYPVSAGVGWEGGFQTYYAEIVEEPEGSPEEGFESEVTLENYAVGRVWAFAAPEHAQPAEAEVSPEALSSSEKAHLEHRRFRFIGCHVMDDAIFDPTKPELSATTERCGNPFANDSGPRYVAFNYGIKGSFFRVPGVFAKHTGSQTDHIQCAKTLDKSHFGDAIFEWKYFVTPVRCEWYGKTKEGEPKYAPYGKHITPYGEWNWGNGKSWEGPWEHHKVGLALYIWASKDKYIGRHETICIDCS